MNIKYIKNWLEERHLCLEQSFVDCLCGFAAAYKKNTVFI